MKNLFIDDAKGKFVFMVYNDLCGTVSIESFNSPEEAVADWWGEEDQMLEVYQDLADLEYGESLDLGDAVWTKISVE